MPSRFGPPWSALGRQGDDRRRERRRRPPGDVPSRRHLRRIGTERPQQRRARRLEEVGVEHFLHDQRLLRLRPRYRRRDSQSEELDRNQNQPRREEPRGDARSGVPAPRRHRDRFDQGHLESDADLVGEMKPFIDSLPAFRKGGARRPVRRPAMAAAGRVCSGVPRAGDPPSGRGQGSQADQGGGGQRIEDRGNMNVPGTFTTLKPEVTAEVKTDGLSPSRRSGIARDSTGR